MEKKLILEVGKKYVCGDDVIVKVLHTDLSKKQEDYQVLAVVLNSKSDCIETRHYSVDGFYYESKCESKDNIVSECKEPEIADLDISDAELIMSKCWVKHKETELYVAITSINEKGVYVHFSVSYKELREFYTWADGSEICKTV